MGKEYYVSKNSAGWMSLKLKSENGDRVVLPLGVDVIKAHAAATTFVNQLSDPGASLSFEADSSDYLGLKIPFKKHLDKTLSEVLVEDPEYLVWIYHKFNQHHASIGGVWKALDWLANEHNSAFYKCLNETSATKDEKAVSVSKHLGEVGCEINLKGVVINCFKYEKNAERKNGGQVYHVIIKDDNDNVISFFSSGLAARVCFKSSLSDYKQSLAISGIVEKHEDYKGTAQTKISKPKVKPIYNLTVEVDFKHQSLQERSLREALTKLKPIESDLICNYRLNHILHHTVSEGDNSGVVKARALYSCQAYLYLTKSELNAISESGAAHQSLPGILGIDVKFGHSQVITEDSHA